MQRIYKWTMPHSSVMLEESEKPDELILTITNCSQPVSIAISKKVWEELWEVTRDRSYGDKFSWAGQLPEEPGEQATEMELPSPPPPYIAA